MAYAATDVIQWAKISQVLAYYDAQKKKALRGGYVDKSLHEKIWVEWQSLLWEYNQDNDSEYLYVLSNYVYALCAPYIFEAMQVSGSGGDVIVPGTDVTRPDREDFIVAADSFLPTGTTSYTFPASWELYGMNFVRGGIPQSTVATEPSYFTWDSVTRGFTCSPALVVGELISIIPS